MRCINCSLDFPTYFPACPDCNEANPLYGVSLKVAAEYFTDGTGISTTSIEVLQISDVLNHIKIHDGTWKMALELHHPGQRQYVIITSANNGAPDAVLWNSDSRLVQPIQRGFCGTAYPYDCNIPHLIVASPLLTDHPWWSHNVVKSPQGSQELVIMVGVRGQVAAWIFHLSHPILESRLIGSV